MGSSVRRVKESSIDSTTVDLTIHEEHQTRGSFDPNEERKDASLPPQMDEVVFYSLHAIQNEKEEKKHRVKWKEREQFKNHVSRPTPIVNEHKVVSGDDMESFNTNSSWKRGRGMWLQQEQQPPTTVGLDQNPVVLNAFVHAIKDGSK